MFESKKNNHLINPEVNQCLEHIIEAKNFANGYIFYGAEGVGKKQAAINFIKQIFKQNNSMGNIDEKISNNNHPDFLIIEPSSLLQNKVAKDVNSKVKKKHNSEILKIDQIRNVKTFLSQKSIESDKKIVLIIDAHRLNEAASNCLLKTLEEPSNGIFILLTTKLNLLLDTIKSRCQIIRFKSFSSKQIENLFQKDLEIVNSKIKKIINFRDLVNSANGSPGKILRNIQLLQDLSEEMAYILDFPLKDSLQILEISKLISENLEIDAQILLILLLQQIWWSKTRNVYIIEKLENLKSNLSNYVQPRLAWEVSLLKISMSL